MLRSAPCVYRTPIRAATSSIRFENPHSLSYQPKTRSRPPGVTVVSGSAITMLSGRARRSLDTSGRSVQPITPPAAASAAFTASAVTGARVITQRSTAETLATGTRTADPLIRPAMPGSTVSSSRWAEVVVGVRPEHIVLAEDFGERYAAATFEADIDVVESLGNELHVSLISQGRGMVARLPAGAPVAAGEARRFAVARGHLLLFEPEHGTRLG